MQKQFDAAMASRPRLGDWSLAHTGRQIWPSDRRSQDIEIRDVARQLSANCRLNGAVCKQHAIAPPALWMGLNFSVPGRVLRTIFKRCAYTAGKAQQSIEADSRTKNVAALILGTAAVRGEGL
jgi:hypothetical protein